MAALNVRSILFLQLTVQAWGKPTREALEIEYEWGLKADDFREGAKRFVGGVGRGGSFSAFQAKL